MEIIYMMESNSLDKEKLKLEKQKIELEKQRLEFEKEKFATEKLDKKTPIVSKGINILGLIGIIGVAISSFLPWVSASSRGFGASFSASASGIATGHGLIILFFVAISTVLLLIKNKYFYIPLTLAGLDCLLVIAGVGSVSFSGGGMSAKAGISLGPIVGFIFSIVGITSAFLKKGNKEINILKFYTKNKVVINISLLLILIIFPNLIYGPFYFRSFIEFVIFTGLYAVVPYFLAKNIDYKRTSAILISLIIFCGVAYFANNDFDSFSGILDTMWTYEYDNVDSAFDWAHTIYYPMFITLLIIGLILDYLEGKNIETPELVNKAKLVFKPYFLSIIFIGLFVCSFLAFSFSRHAITQEDLNEFKNNNSEFVGDWYFLSVDGDEVVTLFFDTCKVERLQIEDPVKANFSAYINEKSYLHFDTIINHDDKIVLPILFKSKDFDIKLKEFDNQTLKFTLMADTKNIDFTATKDKQKLINIVNQTLKKQQIKEEQIAKQLELEEHTIIATFSYTEFGDYFHLVFEDENGKEWDFGSGQNNINGFDFGEEQPNLDLVGKIFKIIWENKKVKSYDLNGNEIEIDAISIVNIELVK